MADKYDIVIAGAGPAGLMAALTAARGGLDVLLIEQKTQITSIHRTCVAGLVTEPDCHEETVTTEGDRIIFHRNDFSIRYSGLWKNLKGFYLVSPAGYRVRMEREVTYVSRILNKEVLLEDLLTEAEKNGVHVSQGTEALSVKNMGDEVVITIRKQGELKEVTGKYLIAADGVNSRIVENLGLNKERKFFGTTTVCSYILQGVESPYPDTVINFLGKGQVEGCKGLFYFWPRPSRSPQDVSLFELLYTLGEKNLEEILNRFMKEGRFSSWFKHAEIVGKTSAIINTRTPISEPKVGNILVIGDAAAFIETFIQGALMYGYRSAKAVIDEIDGKPGLDEYVEYWKSTYGYFKEGVIEQDMSVISALNDSDLDYLFELTDSKSYKGFYNRGVIRKALTAEVPRIMKERPDLIPKLQKLIDQASIK